MNLASIIDDHDARLAALVSRGRTTTYGELREQVDRFRGSLVQIGVGRGDRVAMLCGNSRYFVVAYLATVGLGAVAIPMNPLSPAPELTDELSTVAPKVVVCEASAVPSFGAVPRDGITSITHVVVTDDKGAALGGRAALCHFDAMLDGERASVVDLPESTPAAMIFTSGTAGSPRAAMLSHGNLLANLHQINSTSDHVSKGDVVFGVLPLFHIFGLNGVLGSTLLAGASVVLVQRFDPVTAVETIVERRVTVVPGAPPVWVALSLLEDVDPGAFAGVRLALTGAARMPDDATERLRRRFGIDLREGYGLTEASPVVTSCIGVENRRGSVGRVLNGVTVRVVDESGDDVLVGDPGEVLVKGANVFLGYWGDPDATQRVVDSDGWLHTGDIATVDAQGYLYLVDRSKDLVIVSGFNVYPAEVEDVLMEHPAVAEAGVIGVPHPHTGEAVRAYVVLRPGFEADEDALIDHCHDYVARYKCPSKVLIVDSLPRNDAGKLLRRFL